MSLFAFFKFGKIKASKKQTDREDRINRFRVNELETKDSNIKKISQE